MNKYQQIREIASEIGGRLTSDLDLLIKKVLERSVYEEEDFAGCKWVWLRQQCRQALTEEDPETGLDYHYFVRKPCPKQRSEDPAGDYVQIALFDWKECEIVVAERVGSMRKDYAKLQRLLDAIFEQHGKIPPVPEMTWPKK